jgi:hypothetical protein
MRASKILGLCVVTVAMAACGGGGNSAPATPATAATGTIRPVTQAQVDVAHYRSADGVYGLVFDRTNGKPKVKVDGENDIIELTMREDRVTRSGQGPAGSLLGYLFLKPDGHRILYVTADGGILFFHGRDELSMNSDAAAPPLGAATITGTAPEPKVEKSASEQLADTFRANAIRTKQTQYTSDDAADLTKVAAAIAAADASAFYTFAAGEGHGGKFAPVPKVWQDAFMQQKPVTSKKGLGKFNAELFAALEMNRDNTDLQIAGLQAARIPEPPADKTPGILWEIGEDGPVFITLDGGRYLIDLGKKESPALVAGVPPVAQWPAPLKHSALGPASVDYLGEQGVVPKATMEGIKKVQDEWHECAKAEGPKVKPLYEAIERENLTGSTKEARKKAAYEKWEKATIAKCQAKQTKMESLVVAATEARNTERMGLLDKSKARIATLGLGK